MSGDLPNSNPSVDPADTSTLLGAFNTVIKKAIQDMDNALPAQIISYDRTTNRAQVKPLIKIVNTSNQSISRAQVASIPVYQFGGGGYLLSVNLKPGDYGWIIACDRDISLFLQGYSESSPNTFRKKSFSDSFFMPDIMRGYTIAEEDLENAVLQNLDGTVKISLGVDKIKIVADNVEIESQNVNINSPTEVKITTTILRVEGEITASGNITPNVP